MAVLKKGAGWTVVVVEADPLVAQLCKNFLRQVPALRLAGTFGDGREAWNFLRRRPVDLAVLEARLPGLDGLELLRLARREGLAVEAVLTAAKAEPRTFQEFLHLGVVDYLLKPFAPSRFLAAADRFLARRRALATAEALSQRAVDRLLGVEARRAALPELPKGLQPPTLKLIVQGLQRSPADFRSCAELAVELGLSKVTVRRYLTYLTQIRRVESALDYSTGGRPLVRRRLKSPPRLDSAFSETAALRSPAPAVDRFRSDHDRLA
ncbi:MAG: response regulator [Deltaproteobacteria bacterium]|nr:response regulator [Deltaproteobacteria bacterium]